MRRYPPPPLHRSAKMARESLLERELSKISRQLRAMGALKIIVFGSFAEGDVRRSSDLDLLVIMPSRMSGKEWIAKIYEEVDREADSDILAFTAEELERALPLSRFLRHALATGKVIYEKQPEG
ncbi:nucleotidyltransferase domain-containing protein [Candidatus Methanocrinis natronophilus]|uniref:Nucleotidyltransferase domain-containing protein n=1 Tax=Candidatus Methanocrinis natronophilus TaxID=3033396 RepID=A0ABT5X4N9_9EURY|nr:nucleotidyltransferase domain-containing protein [Candidatus Methanocrinis natronophilus]MDF0589669.1 nucleotidyltransferase domain-containing protein [Candidatus Methanocrinis natronophilus]